MTTTEAPVGQAGHRVAPLVVGSVFCVLALVFLVGGGWALWKDRVDRDADGYVSFGTTDLRTETHAIVGDPHGDGPTWLYEETMPGDARVRATSQTEEPLFIGIAPTDDVFYTRRRWVRDDRQLRGHGRHDPRR